MCLELLLVDMWVRCLLCLMNNGLEIDRMYLQIILIKTTLYKVPGILFLNSGVRRKEHMTKERHASVIRCSQVTTEEALEYKPGKGTRTWGSYLRTYSHPESFLYQRPRSKLLQGRLILWALALGLRGVHSSREVSAPECHGWAPITSGAFDSGHVLIDEPARAHPPGTCSQQKYGVIMGCCLHRSS